MTHPKKLRIDVQQGNGTYDVEYDPDLPCEKCFDEKTEDYIKGAYGNKGNEFGLCLKHYKEATWLDKHAIIEVISQ